MTSPVTSTEGENDDLKKQKIDMDTCDGQETEMLLETPDDRKALRANTLSGQGTSDEGAAINKLRDQADLNSSTESYGLCWYYCFIQRNKSVIFLIMTVLSTAFTSFGWILFLVPLGKEKGLVPSQAVLLSTVAGLGALFGRVWCVMLLWKKETRPFYYFGPPAFLQCLAFIFLSLIANDYFTLMVVSFLAGVPFGVTGAAVGGVCALKVSPSDFQTALALIFFCVMFGTEAGGGLCGE
ncbi:hypothetical protein HOLleu_32053 [Holothuria leucospilota]|uniref:Uncharacterized protein n=1 Tax=Holothuria leucospilota TaxID=206669 RepID=A0A9Q1BGP5_HOLLE|nr:hypothetical protein HOLleu_32053 [Holothuria leucospilota]